MLFKNKRTIADPQSVWIKKNLLDFINDTLSSKNFLSADIVNNLNIKEYLNNVSKRDDHFNSSFNKNFISRVVEKTSCRKLK